MKKVEHDILLRLYSKIDYKFKAIFISTFIWGFIAHGTALTNKYSMHDDIALSLLGLTVSGGRWFLQILGDMASAFLQSPILSLPLINGLLAILCISISAYLIITLFEVKHISMCIAISGLMVVFPTIVGFFNYMFSAPYNGVAILLSTLGTFFICEYRNKWSVLFSIFILSCSLGIYQACLPFILCILLIFFIKRVDEQNMSLKQFFTFTFYLFGVCLAFVSLYFAFTQLSLWYYNTTLTDYQGISSAGREGIKIYMQRAMYAYRYFFKPVDLFHGNMNSMFPMRNLTMYYISMIMIVIIYFYKLYIQIRCKKYIKAMQAIVLVSLIPLAENFIFVMSEPQNVHSCMTYSQVFHFILLTTLIDNVTFNCKKIYEILYVSGFLVLMLTTIIYTRYANAFYLKMEFEQQRTISYFTTLVTQIKSTVGYKDEYPVAFINVGYLSGINSDLSVRPIDVLSYFRIAPLFGGNNGITTYSWLLFINNWLGYSPNLADPNIFGKLPDVQKMPSYPDYGSIKIINNTVVVKF